MAVQTTPQTITLIASANFSALTMGRFVEFLSAVMPRNLPLRHHVGKGKTTDACEFRRLSERQKPPGIQRGSELVAHALLRFRLRNTEASGDRLRDVEGDSHRS